MYHALVRYVVLLACAAACGDNVDGNVTVVADVFADQVGELANHIPGGRVVMADAPGGGFTIHVADDPAIPLEGYRLSEQGRTIDVAAHDVLGAQYGTAAALEHLGFRFRHPFDPYVPVNPRDGNDTLGVVHQPEVRVRGFHFHTLHPIEAHYALYAGDTETAHRILDWAIANRTNYVQWPVLDDILQPDRHAEWQAFTRELIDYAHARGLRIGLNIQLFGNSSLQHSLTVVDSSSSTPVADQIAARLPLVVDGLPFDAYDVSFGEFFDADPTAFIGGLNELAKQIHQLAPGAEVHALIHDGATQLVTYMGQTMIYYFLVQYADPSIIPDIHTTFYYDLFEDAGGAYQMQDFSPHRKYLVDRMCAHQPAAYHPEDAYWYAFDDAVPVFLPLYVRSRHYDLQQLRIAAPPPCGPLDNQLLFSTGWEWGYWLNDVAAMRASYELPATPDELIADALSPDLSAAAPVIADLANVQHDALIGQRLGPYLAGRDSLIDAGRMIGVISLPDRVTFDDLAGGADPDAFQANVLTPLAAHASAVDALSLRLQGIKLPDSRWARELSDGVAIDAVRTHFVVELYTATLAHLAGDDVTAKASRARAYDHLAQASAIIKERHADLHDPDKRLISRDANATAYAFGYLFFADDLCYWQRELGQVDAILGNTTTVPPSCVF